jgi:hypothetical protein
VLKLLMASAALLASWYWARSFFSRVIDGTESITKGAFAMRLAALIASVIWFMSAVFGVLGSLFGWLILAAVIAIVAKFLIEGLRVGQAAQTRPDEEPPRENDL